METRSRPPSRSRAVVSAVVLCGLLAGLSVALSPDDATTRASSASDDPAVASMSPAEPRPPRPRRVLPTRTTHAAAEVESSLLSCPLEALVAASEQSSDDIALTLPSALQVQFTPPVVPATRLELRDGEVLFSSETAQRCSTRSSPTRRECKSVRAPRKGTRTTAPLPAPPRPCPATTVRSLCCGSKWPHSAPAWSTWRP